MKFTLNLTTLPPSVVSYVTSTPSTSSKSRMPSSNLIPASKGLDTDFQGKSSAEQCWILALFLGRAGFVVPLRLRPIFWEVLKVPIGIVKQGFQVVDLEPLVIAGCDQSSRIRGCFSLQRRTINLRSSELALKSLLDVTQENIYISFICHLWNRQSVELYLLPTILSPTTWHSLAKAFQPQWAATSHALQNIRSTYFTESPKRKSGAELLPLPLDRPLLNSMITRVVWFAHPGDSWRSETVTGSYNLFLPRAQWALLDGSNPIHLTFSHKLLHFDAYAAASS